MSTVAIIVIAAVVLLLVVAAALTVFSPRKRAERRLKAERERAAEHHRREAEDRQARASEAQRRAEEAQLQAETAKHEARLEAQRAELHESRASLHDRGMADDELEFGLKERGDAEARADDGHHDDRGQANGDVVPPEDRGRGRFGRDGTDRAESGIAAANSDQASHRPPPRT